MEKTLVAMNERLGLAFGAYDLIVTPDNRTVFLEVNPLGRWLWLEKKANRRITSALGEYMIEP